MFRKSREYEPKKFDALIPWEISLRQKFSDAVRINSASYQDKISYPHQDVLEIHQQLAATNPEYLKILQKLQKRQGTLDRMNGTIDSFVLGRVGFAGYIITVILCAPFTAPFAFACRRNEDRLFKIFEKSWKPPAP